MAHINIEFTLFSAFYSPLISVMSHSRMGATKHDGHRAGQRSDQGAGRA
jgi:hypothetical protein